MGAPRRVTLRIRPPVPFGDVAMVPAPLSGRSEREMARAIAALTTDDPASAADVYLAPLGARPGTLAMLMHKIRRPIH
jgi:hypothetical protein